MQHGLDVDKFQQVLYVERKLISYYTLLSEKYFFSKKISDRGVLFFVLQLRGINGNGYLCSFPLSLSASPMNALEADLELELCIDSIGYINIHTQIYICIYIYIYVYIYT